MAAIPLVPFLTDVGAEVLFFLVLSTVSANLYYWVLARANERASDRAGQVLSAAINALMAVSLIAQPYLFGLTGLERIDVPFLDDHNRAVYFWVAGIFGGLALSFPFHRRTLIEL
ncbi:MAG: hypothetical protein Q8K11_18455, partial [Phenylobacterium sp.]|uniref:hypothetical protein n=1 Tax=Phenylobacterium sp. TaxID=1871053 RepID=UPI002730831E